MTQDGTTPNHNSHVTDYIAYYTALPHSPGYAVMINGPWGIGKTFLIKRMLGRRIDPTKKSVYVSLYGLTSADEIDDALLKAKYPALGWKMTKLASRAANAALKYKNIEFGLSAAEVLNKFDADLYVFDDLERFEGGVHSALDPMFAE